MFSRFVQPDPDRRFEPPQRGAKPEGDARKGPTGTPKDASTLGVKVFLLSLGMLFGASMLGYVITRVRAESWDGYRIEGLGFGLALSTLLLVLCSLAIHRGVVAIRAGDGRRLSRTLALTWILALGFLASQMHNWLRLVDAHGPLTSLSKNSQDLSLFLFYVLTALHAVHVLGGFVPLSIVSVKAARGRYDPADHRGVVENALYWHFLDGVWIVIALALYVG